MGYANAILASTGGAYPRTLAFIHEDDTRKDMNLMLSETVDAVVKGYDQLFDALDQYSRDFRFPDAYHPHKQITSEKDAIA